MPPLVTAVHCCIHREALATKTMPTDLRTVLDDAVRTVNFIERCLLQSCLFAILRVEMGSDHQHGKVLTRLYELREEVQTFFADSWFELSDQFCDFEWLCKLAYLADIFSYLNGLNLLLQGKAETMFHVNSKTEATIKKLLLRDRRVADRKSVV